MESGNRCYNTQTGSICNSCKCHWLEFKCPEFENCFYAYTHTHKPIGINKYLHMLIGGCLACSLMRGVRCKGGCFCRGDVATFSVLWKTCFCLPLFGEFLFKTLLSCSPLPSSLVTFLQSFLFFPHCHTVHNIGVPLKAIPPFLEFCYFSYLG